MVCVVCQSRVSMAGGGKRPSEAGVSVVRVVEVVSLGLMEVGQPGVAEEVRLGY